ncbi:hypothetical protein ASA1KI_31290 [Opitutales bacterium ASA1]|nr:hypothetical protein ASA1KI_31290 [Opitutales bacterium ASA1]
MKRKVPPSSETKTSKLHLSPIQSSTSRTGQRLPQSLPGATGGSGRIIVSFISVGRQVGRFVSLGYLGVTK